MERVQAKGGIWDQSMGWFAAHWLDLMAGAPAIVATIIVVDVTKPFIKLWLAKKLGDSYTEAIENAVIKAWAFPIAFIWAATLDFTTSFNRMTGAHLAWWQGMLLGTALTAGVAMFIVWLKVAETVRVRFQRLTGVTRDDIDEAKTVRGAELKDEIPEGRVTSEMVETFRRENNLDDKQ